MKHPTRHLDMGTLLAYRDHELAADRRSAVQMHLKDCESCQHTLQALTQQAAQVSGLLGSLNPTALDASNTRRALTALRQHTTASRSDLTMWDRIRSSKLRSNKRFQRALGGIGGLVIVVGLFSLAPIRALAADFLGLFRVETFVTVQITGERIEQLSGLMEQGMGFGEITMVGEGAVAEAASLEEAAAQAGFTPVVPSGYGDPLSILVSDPQSATFTPDVAAMRDVYTALGLDPALIPDNIDGEVFTFTLPVGVTALYAGQDGTQFALTQVPSPTVDGPEDVDLQQLGEALLQLLGMSAEEAERLSESIDWTTTLVVPIPQNLASVREVEIGGVTGLAFEASDSGDPDGGNHVKGGGIVWQKNGYVFALSSDSIATPTLIAIAESLN